MRLFRSKRRPRWAPPAPIPDGDQVLAPGQQKRWADLLAAEPTRTMPMAEPTQVMPLARPLMTRAGWWRATSGATRTRLADPHEPLRPQWTCGHCHAQWPCAESRTLLRAELGYDTANLAAYMSVRLFDAAADLGLTDLPAELVNRFLSWAGGE